jgi:phosphoribosylaminoimidazolecarboxamide formyltransferase/IMP cyclohydrolase
VSASASGDARDFPAAQRKELSYNNIADGRGVGMLPHLRRARCVIIKHANPCGVAIADSRSTAMHSSPIPRRLSGTTAFNRQVDAATAEAVAKQFVEVVIAPSYAQEAMAVFASKQNVRVLTIGVGKELNKLDMKRVGGGLLVQASDAFDVSELRIVTRREPSKSEMNDLIRLRGQSS